MNHNDREHFWQTLCSLSKNDIVTERELNKFLNRQNTQGQKIILSILHDITIYQLQEKYPSIADIQCINSSDHSCDEIALLFAKQLIKRLKTK